MRRGPPAAAESIRSFLIADVRWFVDRAQNIPGVCRIALIGSLTTAKKNPKDVDLLVWVADDADLCPLAAAARQLKGRTQSRNRGADIFLANPRGEYLGRICHYRDCRPGVRMTCRAGQCGRRSYLCDDLNVLTLPAKVIQVPPLDLWPVVIHRCPMPQDLERLLGAMPSDEAPTAADLEQDR
jgi:hypothetical protein